MRSIRRSLTLYFLALLALGLGVAALVIDRAAGRTLAARRQAASKLIETQYNDRCAEERLKRDQELSNEARELYTQMQVRYSQKIGDEIGRFIALTALSDALVSLSPSRWTRASMVSTTTRSPGWIVSFLAGRHYFSNLELDDGLVPPASDGDPDPHPGLYQLNIASRTTSLWRSKSLGGFTFPTDEASTDANKVFNFHYDTITVAGVEYRHVVFKAQLASWTINRPRPPQRGPGPPRPNNAMLGVSGGTLAPLTLPPSGQPLLFGFPPVGSPSSPPPDRGNDSFPRVYVHCARPAAAITAKLDALTADRDRQLDELATSIGQDRAELRLWLAGIGGAFFLGVLTGGPLIIRRGLAPVRKLSDAVSQVSERDFTLPVRPTDLSRELLPIHDRLTQTLDALRRAFEREKQSVADISHELRTPIAAMLATIDVSLRKPRSAEQYRTTLEESRVICKELGKLVERIMTLARLDAGHDAIQPAPVDLVDMAEGCAVVIRPLAAEKGVAFTRDYDPAVEVVTDPDKLREVVMNLLHNAVEYNRPGGRVSLAVRSAPDHGAVIEVADTGIGMSPEVAGRIFERFFRADPSRHAATAHAGLGLAIVKEYLGRVGGSIAVDSEPGAGTTFRIKLPAACPGCEAESKSSLVAGQLVAG